MTIVPELKNVRSPLTDFTSKMLKWDKSPPHQSQASSLKKVLRQIIPSVSGVTGDEPVRKSGRWMDGGGIREGRAREMAIK